MVLIFKTTCFSCPLNQESLWQPLSPAHYLPKPIKVGHCAKNQEPLPVHKQRDRIIYFWLTPTKTKPWMDIPEWIDSTHVCQSSESMSAPSSPISITFESCWPAQSWQRSCPVRAHSASGYLTTLDCLPCPTQQCIAFFWYKKILLFAASLRF